jgi:hypothetical protein
MKILVMIPGKPPETRELELTNIEWKNLRMVISPMIDGQEPEHVTVWSSLDNNAPFERLDMFVGETSANDGQPRNEAATTHYRRATMTGKTPVPTPANPEELPAIYGPAVLFGRRVWY